MAGTKVQIKRSSVAGRVPSASDIDVGQLAVNFTDKRFFTKDTSNTVIDVFGQSLNTTANVSFRDGAFANLSATTLAGNLEWSYITSKPDLKIGITGDATGNTTFADLANGSIEITLANTTVTAGTYGNSSVVPVITVDSKGRITSATTNAVAGITGYSYTAANNTFAITAGDGSVYKATIDTVNALSVSSNLVVTGVGEFSNDVSITGNLTVLGTTSFINTTQLDIGDNIITLNSGTTGTPVLDAGIEIERGTSPNVSLLWDETANAWTFTNDGTTYQQLFGNNDFDTALTTIVDGYANAASNAYSNAVSVAATDATDKAANAYSNAVSFATDAAANAYSNAVSTAATDATDKAANAYSNAVSYADTAAATAYSNATSTAATDAAEKAANAYSNAVSYAGTIAATAYSNAVSTAATDASTKAATAYSNAVSVASADASTKADTAYSNAVSTAATDASTKAATAYSNAVSTAATDASTKAATAYSNAVSTAATDASTKAATAYSNAISTAATDASTKAATAYSNAVSYADTVAAAAFTNAAAYAASNTYVNNNFAKLSGAVFTGPISGVTSLVAGDTTIDGVVNTNIGFNINGTSSRVLTANASGIWPNSNAAAMYLGSTAARWEYVYANNGVFTSNVSVGYNLSVTNMITAAYVTVTGQLSIQNVSSQGISVDADLNMIPGATAANGFVVKGYRGGFSNTNLKIENSGVATFANTIVAPTIFVGNSTVNATVNSTAFALNGVPIGGSGSADIAYANAVSYANSIAATAYSNAVSYADTKAATAYSNAVSYADSVATTAYNNATTYATAKAANAYSNAVAYAAANTYVNTTFAPKASPTFTGTVVLPGVSANGSTGTAGQVLTTDGTQTYWSTVTSGGSFTNGQSISVANIVVTDTASLVKVSANGSVGSAGQVLTSDGTNTYWSTVSPGGNSFGKIVIAGQSNVVADSVSGTLTLVAGNNIVLTANASTDAITISSTASGGGGSTGNSAGNAFIAGRDNFTGDGTTTTFTLSQTASANSILVLAEGLVQFHDEDYDVSGTALTFAVAPANNEHLEVIHLAGASTYHFMEYAAIDTFTGDGSMADFTLSHSANTSTATVYLDGLLQAPTTDFSISGSTLTFTSAPLSGETVIVYHNESVSSAIPGIAIASTDVFAGDGTTTAFTLSGTANSGTSMVTVNGLLQSYTTHYTVSGTTLTFVDAPPDGSVVQAVRLNGSVGTAFNAVTVGNTTLTAASTASMLSFANTAGVTLTTSNTTITVGLTDIAKQSLTGNGSNTEFTLSYSANADDLFVYVNGIYFHPDEDYTVANTTLTFTVAPVDTSQIRIRFMRAPSGSSGLLSLMGDLELGSGSYDLDIQDGSTVDLNA